MRNKVKVCLFFICGLFLSSCASWQAVKVAPGLNVSNEIIIKPELQNLIEAKGQNIKIALRVPGAPKSITQETQKEVSRPYDSLERELSRAGFIVRDRELLEKITSELKPSSYMELARAIDTDLILEILYLGPCDLSHNKYYDLGSERMFEFKNPSPDPKRQDLQAFPMRGGQIDCRIITVRDGTVSGMFTLYNLPCDGLCDFEVLKGKEWRNPEPNREGIKGWGVGSDEQNVFQLAGLLVQTLNEGEVVVSKVEKGSPAAHYGLMSNDVIEKINSQEIYNLSQAQDLIVKSSGKTEILLKRDGKEVPVLLVKKFAEPIGAQLFYRAKPQEVQSVAEEKLLAAPAHAVVAPAEVSPVVTPAESVSKDDNKPSVTAAPAKAAKKAKKQQKQPPQQSQPQQEPQQQGQ